MIHLILRALALADRGTRRHLAVAAGLSTVAAAMEGLTFAVVVPLGTVLAGGDPPEWTSRFGIEGADDALAPLGLAVGVLYLLKTIANLANAWVAAGLHAGADAQLASDLFRKYLRLPYEEHLGRNAADATLATNYIVSDVAGNILGASAMLFAETTVLLALLAGLVAFEPVVAIGLACYLMAAGAGFSKVVAPKLAASAKAEHAAFAGANRHLLEGLAGIKAFLSTNGTGRVGDAFAAERRALAVARRTRVFVLRLPQVYIELTMVVGVAAVASFLLAVRTRAEALGLMAALVVAAFRLLPSMSRLLSVRNSMRAAAVSLARLESELELPTSDETPIESDGSLNLNKSIELRGVSFRYRAADRSALSDVSVVVPSGRSVGIVGASGAGKTTLVDVLMGLLTPTRGSVVVDGYVLDERSASAWRRQVGYVPQDVFLIEGSIADNVRFGADASDPEVLEVLDHAELGSFVRSLPEGVDTQIGERGARLSGGQRQRIGIARALLRRPALLLLDEATSAMDNRTEAAIAETIVKLAGRMTVLIVAHRLSTVRRCDQIVLLEDGAVAAMGSFEELERSNESFAHLVALGRM